MDTTEEKILKTAKKVFLRKGYAGTTTEVISARSGLNKSLIHYYFRRKKDLYRKVLRQMAEEELIPLLEGLNTDVSIEKNLKLLHHIRVMLNEKYPRLPIILIDREDPGHNILLEEFRKSGFNLKPFEKNIADRTYKTSFKRSESGILLMTLLSISIFPDLFRDVMSVWLNLSNNDYEKFVKQLHEKIFGMQ